MNIRLKVEGADKMKEIVDRLVAIVKELADVEITISNVIEKDDETSPT